MRPNYVLYSPFFLLSPRFINYCHNYFLFSHLTTVGCSALLLHHASDQRSIFFLFLLFFCLSLLVSRPLSKPRSSGLSVSPYKVANFFWERFTIPEQSRDSCFPFCLLKHLDTKFKRPCQGDIWSQNISLLCHTVVRDAISDNFLPLSSVKTFFSLSFFSLFSFFPLVIALYN